MAAVHLVILARVDNIPHLARVGVDTALLVFDHRAVLPARFPQLVAHLAILIRHVVAFVVLGQTGPAIAAPGAFQIRSHDIPGHPALGKMVERRDESGKSEGMVLEDRTGKGEA